MKFHCTTCGQFVDKVEVGNGQTLIGCPKLTGLELSVSENLLGCRLTEARMIIIPTPDEAREAVGIPCTGCGEKELSNADDGNYWSVVTLQNEYHDRVGALWFCPVCGGQALDQLKDQAKDGRFT